jgi:phosphatidylserine/phosphatidylglycerophosphate/cardiolipin synthase-like enzyme
MRISNPLLALSLLALLSPGAARAQDRPAQIWATPATIASCLVPGCDGTKFISDAIDGAQRELRIQFYSFTSAPIAAAIVRAQTRGVDVAVLLDKTSPCQRGAAADEVKAAGIPVAIDSSVRIAHNKVVVIDRARVIEGSFNASVAAMKNAENTNLVAAPAIAEAYRAQWERRAALSVPYVDRSHSCRTSIRDAGVHRHGQPNPLSAVMLAANHSAHRF